ncbi:MAG TPA: LysR family transcriptional regulator [Polyangiaceae bacterium]|jgi:DNA-binding transcriptional LysR family regulator|nr:LysR family transcriptional regulator [Polyangiaceae bacterium]
MKDGSADLFSGVLPFVTAAEVRSFRVAARKLGLTPSAVSKAITRLEARLGLRLLNRTSRAVSLTEEGQAFLSGCQEAVTSLRTAEERVLQTHRAPRGRLTVSLPLLLGKLVVLPALKPFCDRYSALSVHVSLTDRLVSLADENVDAVVRVGKPPDSRLSARKLRDVRWVTVAAPAYLAQRGIPRTPQELISHNCIKFVLPSGTVQQWQFGTPGAELGVSSTPGSLSSDHGEGLIEAACAGIGLFQAHDYSVAKPLAAGRLVEVLADFSAPGPPIWLLMAPGRRVSPKVRAFVDFIVDTMGERA